MKRIRSLTSSGERITQHGKYKYYLYRDMRARRMSMRWQHDRGLIIVIPVRITIQNALSFINSNEKWIENRQKQWLTLLENPEIPNFRIGGQVMYKGRLIPVKAKDNGSSEPGIIFNEEIISIINPDQIQATIESILVAVMRDRARQEFIPLVRKYAKEFSIEVKRISIRDQRTRWGSWSSRNNMNLNWRLIMLPDPIIHYIIIHELMHHYQPNHSKAFWISVEKHCPNWKNHRNELKKYVHFISLFR
ncbi:M48 family metallopeptidase [bacterium]|nr:M48 family metallopeptidase [bacterium]